MKERPKKKISIEVLRTTYLIRLAGSDGINREIGTIKVSHAGSIKLGKGTSFTTDELAEILRQLPKVEEE
jgi:hypothetical protein